MNYLIQIENSVIQKVRSWYLARSPEKWNVHLSINTFLLLPISIWKKTCASSLLDIKGSSAVHYSPIKLVEVSTFSALIINIIPLTICIHYGHVSILRHLHALICITIFICTIKFGNCIITQTLNIAFCKRDGFTDRHTDNPITRCPRRTFQAGHKNRWNKKICPLIMSFRGIVYFI